MKFFLRCITVSLILLSLVSGASAKWRWLTGVEEEERKPILLFLPITCDNAEVATKINEGFEDAIHSKTERMNLDEFDIYLSSFSIDIPLHLYPVKKKSVGLTDKLVAQDPILGGQAQVEVKEEESVPDVDIRDFLTQRLRKDPAFQRAFYEKGGVRFFGLGQSKEMVLTELEFGNLQTAETASIEIWDLKQSELILNESFRQRGFEIVAPERIGKKLALEINKVFSEIYRKEERQAKEARKAAKKQSKLLR